MFFEQALPTTLLAIATGVGLAASAGLRVFLPLLLAGLAARTGQLPVADGFAWLGSDPALLAFAVATACEIVASFIPYVDHLLDLVGAPAAVAAGTLLAASALVDVAPGLRWVLALIAGGGTAGLVHGTTAGLRVGSTVATASLANPLLAGAELGAAAALAVLAIALPLVAVVLIVVLLVRVVRRFGRRGAVALVVVVALGGANPVGAADGEATRLIDFRIKDQFDTLHTSGSCRGAVAVVVYRDREGRHFVDQWEPALRDSLADLSGRYRVRFVPVAHLKGVPFFIKGTIKGKMQEENHWILMDYKGLFKRTYALPDDMCTLLVFDRGGRLQARHAVTDFDPARRDALIAEIRELAAASR